MPQNRAITNWSQVKLMLRLDEVAFILDVSDEHVRRLCVSGKLPATKIGGVWRVEKGKLQEYLGLSK